MNPIHRSNSVEKYLKLQQNSPHDHPTNAKREPNGRFVTISRQAGAGGTALARNLANRLTEQSGKDSVFWVVFDKSLVQKVLEKHNLPEKLAKYMEEAYKTEIRAIIEESLGLHPSQELLARKTSETILHLAKLGKCIILGRGAQVVTRNLGGGLHVRLVGSVSRRIQNIKERFNGNEAEAGKYIHDEDENRAKYLKKFFRKNIDDALLYDMVINTDYVEAGEAARWIAAALSRP